MLSAAFEAGTATAVIFHSGPSGSQRGRDRADLAGHVDDPRRRCPAQQRQQGVGHVPRRRTRWSRTPRAATPPWRPTRSDSPRAMPALLTRMSSTPYSSAIHLAARRDRLLVGDVERDEPRVRAAGPQPCRRRLAAGRSTRADQHGHPPLAEQPRRLVPDALVGAGHQCSRHASRACPASAGETGRAEPGTAGTTTAAANRAPWRDATVPSSPRSCAAGVTGCARPTSAFPAATPPGGVRPACAARRSRSSPASRSTTTSAWSRAAARARPGRSSPRWPARSC